MSRETGLLREWPAEGPRVLWRRPAGDGFSGIAVANDRLYTLWDEDGSQLLVCLQAATGALEWSRRVGPAFENGYGNGPRSTPLVDAGVVHAIGTNGNLVAASAKSGELLWQVLLQDDFGARLPAYGYASSPLIAGERLFVETGGQGSAYTAFDKHTGEPLWSAGDDLPAYSSPVHLTLHGEEQVLFWSAGGLNALSLRDGGLLWTQPWRTDCPSTGDPLGTGTPIPVAPDKLFLSAAYASALVQVSRGPEGFSVRPVWQARTLRNDVNSSVLVGDHVYGFDRGTLKCIEVHTGVVNWKAREYGKGSLIAADGLLIVFGERGVLALVEPNPERFVERSRAAVLRGKSWTAPCLARGRLYVRNHAEVVGIDLRGES